MDEKERQFWFDLWRYGSLAMDKLAKLAFCLNLANQLKINGSSFDIHIDTVSPQMAGALTTTIGGNRIFYDLDDLKRILYMDLDELKRATRKNNDEDS